MHTQMFTHAFTNKVQLVMFIYFSVACRRKFDVYEKFDFSLGLLDIKVRDITTDLLVLAPKHITKYTKVFSCKSYFWKKKPQVQGSNSKKRSFSVTTMCGSNSK